MELNFYIIEASKQAYVPVKNVHKRHYDKLKKKYCKINPQELILHC